MPTSTFPNDSFMFDIKKNLYSTYFCHYVLIVNVCALCNKIMFLTRQCIVIKVSFLWEIQKGESYMYININSYPSLKIAGNLGALRKPWLGFSLPAETVDTQAPWHLPSKD